MVLSMKNIMAKITILPLTALMFVSISYSVAYAATSEATCTLCSSLGNQPSGGGLLGNVGSALCDLLIGSPSSGSTPCYTSSGSPSSGSTPSCCTPSVSSTPGSSPSGSTSCPPVCAPCSSSPPSVSYPSGGGSLPSSRGDLPSNTNIKGGTPANPTPPTRFVSLTHLPPRVGSPSNGNTNKGPFPFTGGGILLFLPLAGTALTSAGFSLRFLSR